MNAGNCESCQLRTEFCGIAEGLERNLGAALLTAETASVLEAGAKAAVDELGPISAQGNSYAGTSPEARADACSRCVALYELSVQAQRARLIVEQLLTDSGEAGYFVGALPRDCPSPGSVTGRCRSLERRAAKAAIRRLRDSPAISPAPGNPV